MAIAPAIAPNNDWIGQAIKLGAALSEQKSQQDKQTQALRQAELQDARRRFEADRRLEFDQQKEATDTAFKASSLDLKRQTLAEGMNPFEWRPLGAGVPAAASGPGARPGSVPAGGVPAELPVPPGVGTGTPGMGPSAGPLQPPPDFSDPVAEPKSVFGRIGADVSGAANSFIAPPVAQIADELPPVPANGAGILPDNAFSPAPMPAAARESAGVQGNIAGADARLAEIDRAGAAIQRIPDSAMNPKQKRAAIAKVVSTVMSRAETNQQGADMRAAAEAQGLKMGDDGRWQNEGGVAYDVGVGAGGKVFVKPAKVGDEGIVDVKDHPGYARDSKTGALFHKVDDKLLRVGGEYQQEKINQANQRLGMMQRNQLFMQARKRGEDIVKATKSANDTLRKQAETLSKDLEHDFNQAQSVLDKMRLKGFENSSATDEERGQFSRHQALTELKKKAMEEARANYQRVLKETAAPIGGLDPKTANEILDQVGRDNKKATEIAKELGFSFE